MTTTRPEALAKAHQQADDAIPPPGGYNDAYRNTVEQWAKQFYRDKFGLVPIYTTEGKGAKVSGLAETPRNR